MHPVQIVYSYAHEDDELRKQLDKHLSALRGAKRITSWFDHDIQAGTERNLEVTEQFKAADIILLLISSDFMASHYCNGVELQLALDRYKAGKARVIPIILRPVSWEDTPIGSLQCLPSNRKPITKWLDKDEAFLDVERGIREVIKTLVPKQSLSSRETSILYPPEETLYPPNPVLPVSPEQPAMYWSRRGQTLFEQGRIEEATQAFQDALRHNSGYAPAWYGIGNVLYAQYQLQDALVAYERAITANPQFVEALERRGFVLADMDKPLKALESYNEALYVNPYYVPAWNSKGSVLCQLERYDQALEAYSQALVLNPQAALAWNGKGKAYYHLNNYRMALDAYDRALYINPNLVSAWHNKSLVLKSLNRNDEALIAAEAALQLAPADPDNWQRKAEALRKLHRRREAREAEAEVMRLLGEVPEE